MANIGLRPSRLATGMVSSVPISPPRLNEVVAIVFQLSTSALVAALSSPLAAAAADTWMWTPFIVLLATAAFRGIPETIYEAAEVDGASPAYRFFRITLPMLMPYIITATLFRLLDSIQQFDIIYAMTQGGPGDGSRFIVLYLYETAFRNLDMGYASAVAWLFFILAALVIAALRRLLGRVLPARGGVA